VQLTATPTWTVAALPAGRLTVVPAPDEYLATRGSAFVSPDRYERRYGAPMHSNDYFISSI